MPLSRNCANESCLQLVPGGSSAAAVDEALDWLEEPAESGNDAGASESSSSGPGSSSRSSSSDTSSRSSESSESSS